MTNAESTHVTPTPTPTPTLTPTPAWAAADRPRSQPPARDALHHGGPQLADQHSVHSPNRQATESTDVAVRVVALAPTYDNARTLGRVIDAVLATGLPLVVVDDGSAPDTAAVLAQYGGRIVVVRHRVNQGKAAALQSGFNWALQHGYTHAVTIDTDGQHDARDLPALVALASDRPDALVLGVRDTDIAGYPRRSRLGRWAANTLVRWQSGMRVADSQCGLRVYPLASVADLPVRSGRYGYETEVLTRAGWAGVAVAQIKIHCVYAIDGGRVSHFRPWVDTLRAARLHVWLLCLALLRWLNPSAAWRAARHDPHERRRLAAAVGVGVFIANLPVYGVQTVLSLFAAKRLGLQPLAVVAGSHLSTPPVGPLLIALAIGIGHRVLHGEFGTPADYSPARIGYVACLRRVALEWTIGSLVCGTVLATLAYVLALLTLRYAPHRRPQGSAVRLDA